MPQLPHLKTGMTTAPTFFKFLWGLTMNSSKLFRKCLKKRKRRRRSYHAIVSHLEMGSPGDAAPSPRHAGLTFLRSYCSFSALWNISASFCTPGREEEEWQGTRWLLLEGFWLFLGKGRPPKGLSPTAHQQKWCPMATSCSQGAGNFSRSFPASLVEEALEKVAGNGCWVNWFLGTPRRPSSPPICLSSLIISLMDMTYHCFGLNLWFSLPFACWFFSSFRFQWMPSPGVGILSWMNPGLSSYPLFRTLFISFMMLNSIGRVRGMIFFSFLYSQQAGLSPCLWYTTVSPATRAGCSPLGKEEDVCESPRQREQ